MLLSNITTSRTLYCTSLTPTPYTTPPHPPSASPSPTLSLPSSPPSPRTSFHPAFSTSSTSTAWPGSSATASTTMLRLLGAVRFCEVLSHQCVSHWVTLRRWRSDTRLGNKHLCETELHRCDVHGALSSIRYDMNAGRSYVP